MVKRLDRLGDMKKASSTLNSRQVSRDRSTSPDYPIINNKFDTIQLNNKHHNMSIGPTGEISRAMGTQSIQRRSTNVTMSQQNSPRIKSSLDNRQPLEPKKNVKNIVNQSVDFVDRCNISINEIIKSSMRKTTGDSLFGISGYHIPNTNIVTQRPRTTKFTHYNVPHFIDKYAKSKEFVPGPKYDTISDWKDNFKGRGHFTKSPRITYTQNIIKEAKLQDSPGPGAYKHVEHIRKKPNDKSNVALSEKICGFIEEAKFMGTESPPTKYDIIYDRVDSDMKYARIKPSKVSRMDKLTKDPNKPAPGDYNTIDAFQKTQVSNRISKIGTSKIDCFVDQAQRAKNFLPGIGAYKVTSKAYDQLSKSPISIRKLRQ